MNLAVGQGDLQAHAAADGGRLRDDGQRRARRAPAPRRRGRGRQRPPLQRIEPAASGRRVTIDPSWRDAILSGLHAATMSGTSPASSTAGTRPLPGLRQDRHGRARRPGRPVLVRRRFVPNPSKPIVLAVTVEQGGFGAEAAAPVARYMLGAWFNQKRVSTPSPGSATDRGLAAVPHPRRRRRRARSGRRRPRCRSACACRSTRCCCSPWSALCAGSLLTIAYATAGRHRRRARTTTSTARRSTSASGSSSPLVLWRVDYSRLRELKYGIYGLLIGPHPGRPGARLASPAARAARSSCPSSSSRSPSSARSCSSSRWPASSSTARGRLSAPRARPPASCCSTLVPAAIVIAQRTSARAWSTSSSASPCSSSRASRGGLRRALRAGRRRRRPRPRRRPRGGVRCSSPTRRNA